MQSFLSNLPVVAWTASGPVSKPAFRPASAASESTRTALHHIFGILSTEETDSDQLYWMSTLLKASAFEEPGVIFNTVNDEEGHHGYTILQEAVYRNKVPQLEALVKMTECDVNAGICTLPLHLACELGHVYAAQILLNHGARADLKCVVCVPDSSGSWFHQSNQYDNHPHVICCRSRRPDVYTQYNAFEVALRAGHLNILKLLLHHEKSRKTVTINELLCQASRIRASEGLEYLIELYSDHINDCDRLGKSPLYYAVHHDSHNTKLLLQHGAKLKGHTEKESILCLIYSRKIFQGVAELTQLLLAQGLVPDVNSCCASGDPLIHCFMVVLATQIYHYREELNCLKILLQYGARLDIVDDKRMNPIQRFFWECRKYQECMTSRALHGIMLEIFLLKRVKGIAAVFLENNAQKQSHYSLDAIECTNGEVATEILSELLTWMARWHPGSVREAMTEAEEVINFLVQSGANVNHTTGHHPSALCLVLFVFKSWVKKAPFDSTFVSFVCPFVEAQTKLFLENGLLAAHTEQIACKNKINVHVNHVQEFLDTLNCLVPNADALVNMVVNCLKLLIQQGANPNCVSMTKPYRRSYLPVNTTNSHMSLRRGVVNLVNRRCTEVLQLCQLLLATLDHKQFQEFRKLVLDVLESECPNARDSHILQYSKTPRNLQGLSRITIYKSLNWQLAAKCPQLPLPPSIITYLRDIQC